jgi:hypothetical protein
MRVVSTRLLAAVAVAASLALASTAWSHPQRMRAPHSAATASTRAKLQNPYSFGWIMGWWNDGSCHGYPDIMEVYVFYGDSATNTITDWEDIGHTDGNNSCSVYIPPTWESGPGWSRCNEYSENTAGCTMYDGYVQGSTIASTSWTPDDGICDGCDKLGANKVAVGRTSALNRLPAGINPRDPDIRSKLRAALQQMPVR